MKNYRMSGSGTAEKSPC